MDKKTEFENVMKGNSYLKLQKIIRERENWNPEAVLAAENELSIRDQTIRSLSEKGLSEISDKEITVLVSDSEKYPEKFIEQIINEKSNRESVIAVKEKAQSDKIKMDLINENKTKQKEFHSHKKEAESQNYQINNQMNNNYKVVPFSPSNNIPISLQGIIDSEAANGWRYVNHQYSDKLQPGSSGCFGIGATSDSTIHVGFVIFERS